MPKPSDSLVLIGYVMKPYGLLGEIKVRPASFDPERHAGLDKVIFKKKEGAEPQDLEIRSSRADAEWWYFKFKGMKTPESVAPLSGGYLFIPEAERLELPEDMVYLSDVPGMKVIDEAGAEIGTVSEVVEQGAGELLKVRAGTKELLIPWNDHFVKSVDKTTRRVQVDISTLRGLL